MLEDRGVDYVILHSGQQEPGVGDRRHSIPSARAGPATRPWCATRVSAQAESWSRASLSAKVEHHARPLFPPAARPHCDEQRAGVARWCASTTSLRHGGAVDQGRQAGRRVGPGCRVTVFEQTRCGQLSVAGLHDLRNLWRRLGLPHRILVADELAAPVDEDLGRLLKQRAVLSGSPCWPTGILNRKLFGECWGGSGRCLCRAGNWRRAATDSWVTEEGAHSEPDLSAKSPPVRWNAAIERHSATETRLRTEHLIVTSRTADLASRACGLEYPDRAGMAQNGNPRSSLEGGRA